MKDLEVLEIGLSRFFKLRCREPWSNEVEAEIPI